MKKGALILSIFVLLFVWTVPVLADGIAVVKGHDSWVITYNNAVIGSLKKSPEDNYMLFDKDGDYVGLVLQSGDLKLPGSFPLITPAISQLHLDAVKALDVIESQQKSGN